MTPEEVRSRGYGSVTPGLVADLEYRAGIKERAYPGAGRSPALRPKDMAPWCPEKAKPFFLMLLDQGWWLTLNQAQFVSLTAMVMWELNEATEAVARDGNGGMVLLESGEVRPGAWRQMAERKQVQLKGLLTALGMDAAERRRMDVVAKVGPDGRPENENPVDAMMRSLGPVE